MNKALAARVLERNNLNGWADLIRSGAEDPTTPLFKTELRTRLKERMYTRSEIAAVIHEIEWACKEPA